MKLTFVSLLKYFPTSMCQAVLLLKHILETVKGSQVYFWPTGLAVHSMAGWPCCFGPVVVRHGESVWQSTAAHLMAGKLKGDTGVHRGGPALGAQRSSTLPYLF